MVAPLRLPQSARLKYGRATEHFNALKRAIESFFNDNPKDLIFDFQPNPDNGEIRVRIKKPIPLDWSLLIGDCIYNLRSSLDHLVWITIGKHGGSPTPRNEFPIFLDRNRYFELDRKKVPTPRSGLAKVEGLPGGMATIIEGLQPYNRRNGPPDLHPLWLLHELSNEDKHRMLNVTHAMFKGGVVTVDAFEGGGPVRFTLPPVPLEDGTVVHTIRPRLGNRPPIKKNVNVKFHFTPGIAFAPKGPGRGMPVIDTLIEIRRFIASDLLPPLRRFVL